MKSTVLDRIALVLAFAGMFISGVLSLAEKFGASIPCGTSHGCDAVAKHPTSHILFGVPNAYIGFGLYAILAVLTALRLFGVGSSRGTMILGYLLSALGTLASLALTYISFTVINATCYWCLSSTGVMAVLFIVHALIWQHAGESAPVRSTVANGVLLAILLLGTGIGLAVEGANLYALAAIVPLDNSKAKNVTAEQLLPKGVHIYGSPDAPIAIVEFGDLLCEACRTEYPLVQDYVGKSNGRVKYVFRHFPMVQLKNHENSLPAAAIAEVAADKGLFWTFLSAMYGSELKEPVTLDQILDIAKAVGVDPAVAVEKIRDPKAPAFERTYRDIRDGSNVGVIGTPAFFIVAPNTPIVKSTMQKLFDDLERPEFQKFKGG